MGFIRKTTDRGFKPTVYGKREFEMKYDHDSLKNAILTCVKENTYANFSFELLCQSVLVKAFDEDNLFYLEEDVYYEEPVLSKIEKDRVSHALCELLRQGNVYYNFDTRSFRPGYSV